MGAEREKRVKRRYSPKRLRERPVEMRTCHGPVIVTTYEHNGRLQIVIEEPGNATKEEPK